MDLLEKHIHFPLYFPKSMDAIAHGTRPLNAAYFVKS
jgi:hypothetical protein